MYDKIHPRKIRFFLALLLVFLIGKFIDFSFNFSAGKLYNPATYQLNIRISAYERKLIIYPTYKKDSRALASAKGVK